MASLFLSLERDTMSNSKPRKSYFKRALTTCTTSRRFQAGTRKNKKQKHVGSFKSDSKVAS
jgi:hypothetical protein